MSKLAKVIKHKATMYWSSGIISSMIYCLLVSLFNDQEVFNYFSLGYLVVFILMLNAMSKIVNGKMTLGSWANYFYFSALIPFGIVTGLNIGILSASGAGLMFPLLGSALVGLGNFSRFQLIAYGIISLITILISFYSFQGSNSINYSLSFILTLVLYCIYFICILGSKLDYRRRTREEFFKQNYSKIKERISSVKSRKS